MKNIKPFVGWIALAAWLLGACTLPPPPTMGTKAVLEQPLASVANAALASSVLLQSCTEAGCTLQPVDALHGTALAGFAPIDSGHYAVFAFAPNHSTLAMIAYPTDEAITNGVLQFVDLRTWQVRPTKLTFEALNDSTLVFSPDGQSLVLSGPKYTWPPGDILQMIDVAQPANAIKQTLDFTPVATQFTRDGAALMVYGIDKGPDKNGVNPTAQVALFKTSDLSLLWQQRLPDLLAGQYDPEKRTDPHVAIWWHPATAFAADQAKLYLVHADANRLTTVDFAKQTVATADIAVKQGWLERLLALTAQTAYAKELNGTSKQAILAPDGEHLYVVGLKRTYEKDVYKETPLGLQVIDLATQQEVARLDVIGQELAISPDGARLFLHGWNNGASSSSLAERTEVVTLATLQIQARLEQQWARPVARLDGEPILLASTTKPTGEVTLATLDPNSLQARQSWPAWEKGAWGWWVAP